MAREINLVPDIKEEMIKTLKLRNFIFFLCAIVAAVSVGVTLIFGLIAGGQQLAVDSKKNTINNLSTKLNSYNDLNEFLTIKDQLGNIDTLSNNKQVVSRTFNILSALIPNGADFIIISELNIDLSESQPTFTMTATANAGEEPFIDYRVLDSFKKSARYMRYDYGNYVDKNGNIIPAYCMIETNSDGAYFNDSSQGLYAYWAIDGEGCNPSAQTSDSNQNSSDGYNTEDYDGQKVVRVWRTPQFNDWYKANPQQGAPYMSLDGNISGVEHFESACITYKGDNSQNSSQPKWTESNDNCWLIPAGTDGISVSESANGRDSSGELVLSFTANILLAPEVYKFTNTHMIALAPSGRHNVTDSYVQIQSMFGEKAAKCAEDDAACNNTANGAEGE